MIDQKNAQSRFHLALHLSYPNTEDRNRARAANTDPGGLIMIHGNSRQVLVVRISSTPGRLD